MLFISCLLQTILVAVTPFGAYSALSGEPNLRVLEMESPGLFGRPSFLDLYCEF